MKTIEYAEAKRIVDSVVEQVTAMGSAVVVAVVDPYSELIAFARMDGAPLNSIKLAMNKAFTAARARRTSQEFGERSRDAVTGFDIGNFGDPRFTGFGGGIPVWRDGVIVGAIGISGLPTEEDIRLANQAAELVAGE